MFLELMVFEYIDSGQFLYKGVFPTSVLIWIALHENGYYLSCNRASEGNDQKETTYNKFYY